MKRKRGVAKEQKYKIYGTRFKNTGRFKNDGGRVSIPLLVTLGVLVFIVIVVVILGLTGMLPIFTRQDNSIQEINKAMDMVLKRNPTEEKLKSGFIIPENKTQVDEIEQMIFDNVEYEILDVHVDYIEMQIKALDLRAIMNEIIDIIDEEKYADDEFDEAKQHAQSLMMQMIEDGGRGKVSSVVKVEYIVHNGEYMIIGNDDYINVIYGNMLDALAEYNEALGLE